MTKGKKLRILFIEYINSRHKKFQIVFIIDNIS